MATKLDEMPLETCVLCGAGSYYNFHKEHSDQTVQHWSAWKSDCGLSLCTLLDLSDHDTAAAASELFASGTFCQQCASKVWDIHFTTVQIRTLTQRLAKLKVSIGNIIKTHSKDVKNSVRKNDKTLHLIGRELDKGINRNHNRIRTTSQPAPESVIDDDDFSNGEDLANGEQQQEPYVKFEIKVEPLNLDCDQENQDREDPDWLLDAEALGDESDDHMQSLELDSDLECPPNEGGITIKRKRGRPRKYRAVDQQAKLKICSVCSSTFRFKGQLLQHIAEQHPDHRFKCTLCPRQYKEEADLELHLKGVHGGVYPFYCLICHHGFHTEEDMTKHREATHTSASNPFTCSTCQAVFTNSVDLEDHVRTHTTVNATPFSCTYCNKSYANQEKLGNHVRHQHKRLRIYKCDICEAAYPSPSELRAHVTTHSTEKTFQCHLCPSMYKNKYTLARHIRKHNGDLRQECRICGKCFRDRDQRKAHEEIHSGTKSYVCATCDKRFATRKYMRAHQIEVHEGRRRIRDRSTGLKRSKNTKPLGEKESDGGQAREKKKKKENRKRIRKVQDTELSLTCSKCHKIFPTRSELTTHKRFHVNSFTCEQPDCGKRFPSQRMLDSHHLIRHSGAVRVKDLKATCEVCGKSFVTESMLKRHAVKHSNDKNFPCTLCPVVLKFPSSLIKHMKQHTGERSHVCDICGKGFFSRSKLEYHGEIHADPETKTHICPTCGKRFKLTQTLKQHIKETHERRRKEKSQSC